ncbi:MAG: zinc ABC transporter substrate-binding protein [Desulfobacterales bacterium]|nr:zinc ABC transporter substrate-binding protein [Desulfobacterales bacterium]
MKNFIKKYTIISFWLLLLPGLVFAIEEPDNRISVFVSIQPQAYFLERIGGDRVVVDVLVMPDKNPATYSPTPDQMMKLSKADLFFRIGVPFENILISKIDALSDRLTIVDTRKGITLRRMESGYHEHDQHNHDHTEGNDPHIWLSPVLVKQQSKTILETLVKIDPDGKTTYTANYRSFIDDLDALDNKIRSALAPIKGSALFVFHPAFGYFAEEYGLKQIAVEIEGKAPKGKDVSLFIKKARNDNVKVIFVQAQFDRSAAYKIASAIDGSVVPVDPLARDYISNLEEMADKVLEGLTR